MKKKRSLGFGFDEWKDHLIPNFDPLLWQEDGKSPWRTTIFLLLTILVFFTIFLRIFHLQVVEGELLRELADGNRIQIRVIHAPRGVIYDRNGKILAGSSPAFRLNDPGTNRARLISREEALELEVKNDPRSKDLEVDTIRTYPKEEAFAHVVGYVGEISPQDLQNPKFKNYKLGDRIGKIGVEAQYESLLKGRDGGEVVEVDSKGEKIRTLRRNAPIPGQSIYLTIDADLQERLYKMIVDTVSKTGACCGAAIASDPTTGQILVLLSLPSYNPNVFTQVSEEAQLNKILSREDSPILNRAISGTYPPGSTFKIVTSLAALASGKITKDTIFEDSGVMYLGPYKFSNWYFNQYGKVEGPLDLLKAIQRSNDIYFYRVGQTIGEDVLISWARKLKLGDKLNIDIPAEAKGLVPDDKWKRETFGQVWYPGDTLHMAIGQGFVLTTPLQILGITSYIAAGGNLYKPYLLLKSKPDLLVSNLLPKEKVDIISEGLKKVPKTGGTAWPFFPFPIETAGKTGTSEYGDQRGRTHAWYTSYAPADDPKIALTILIEGGGEGSSIAAPIAKELYRWYFSEDKSKLIQDVYVPATESARTLGE